MAFVETSYRDAVAYVHLNRPERLNAVVPGLLDELCGALTEAAEGATGVVVAGHGRAFCSGHDLKESNVQRDPASHRRDVTLAQDVTRLMKRFPGPVVAAVHGYALGAGAEIALAADFVIASEGATFGFPEVQRGLSVTGGISNLLPRLVGLARANELMLLGDWISGTRALEIGLIYATFAEADLQREATVLITRLLAQPHEAFVRAKRTLLAGVEGSLEQALEYEVVATIAARAAYPESAE